MASCRDKACCKQSPGCAIICKCAAPHEATPPFPHWHLGLNPLAGTRMPQGNTAGTAGAPDGRSRPAATATDATNNRCDHTRRSLLQYWAACPLRPVTPCPERGSWRLYENAGGAPLANSCNTAVLLSSCGAASGASARLGTALRWQRS